jgi:hypothetical protein
MAKAIHYFEKNGFGLCTLWAIFSKTHLVTLVPGTLCCSLSSSSEKHFAMRSDERVIDSASVPNEQLPYCDRHPECRNKKTLKMTIFLFFWIFFQLYQKLLFAYFQRDIFF